MRERWDVAATAPTVVGASVLAEGMPRNYVRHLSSVQCMEPS
ncbi:hypothetical protein STRIP9103_06251 [Streptomyces ipomoeae 91-03]|uniref:Uncharacterized protein n=1 Tax=Streptomyces ipomoeae 91-03 TaxID=698759 RepID=L1L297_9ACTN|nr:hypothetical protein STRIP9103_06251 [Streptomyces ipomoeae 91-03]